MLLLVAARLTHKLVLADLPHAVDSLHRKHSSWLWKLALTQLITALNIPTRLNQRAWTTIRKININGWSYGFLHGRPAAYSCLPKGEAGFLSFILATYRPPSFLWNLHNSSPSLLLTMAITLLKVIE